MITGALLILLLLILIIPPVKSGSVCDISTIPNNYGEQVVYHSNGKSDEAINALFLVYKQELKKLRFTLQNLEDVLRKEVCTQDINFPNKVKKIADLVASAEEALGQFPQLISVICGKSEFDKKN